MILPQGDASTTLARAFGIGDAVELFHWENLQHTEFIAQNERKRQPKFNPNKLWTLRSYFTGTSQSRLTHTHTLRRRLWKWSRIDFQLKRSTIQAIRLQFQISSIYLCIFTFSISRLSTCVYVLVYVIDQLTRSVFYLIWQVLNCIHLRFAARSVTTIIIHYLLSIQSF